MELDKKLWYEKSDIESLTLFYNQAEKALTSTISIIEILDKKADSIALRSSMFLLGGIAFVATNFSNDFFIHLFSVVCAPLILAIIKTKISTDPTEVHSIGYPPHLFMNEGFANKYEGDGQKKMILLRLCEDYSRRISDNEKVAKKKSNSVEESSFILSTMTPILGLIFLFVGKTLFQWFPLFGINIASILTLFFFSYLVSHFLGNAFIRFVRR